LLIRDQENVAEARRLLDDIIAAEPGYAEGYALLSDWYSLIVAHGWSKNRTADIEIIGRTAQQALALDGDNVRALVLFGHRKSWLHREYDTAKDIFARALNLQPSSALAWAWSSVTYSYVGEVAEAQKRASRALQLSPRDREAHIFLAAKAVAHYAAGDFAAARDWALRAIAENFVFVSFYRYAVASLVACGELQRAKEIARRGMELMPNQRVSDIVRENAFRDVEQREPGFRSEAQRA
jgi:tetratricopeptide (TPR) repeat protein